MTLECLWVLLLLVCLPIISAKERESRDLKEGDRKQFSTYQCIGGSQVLRQESLFQTSVRVWPLNNPEFRTCHYQNVCLVNGSLTFFQKYAKGGHVPEEYLPSGFGGNVNHLSYLRGFTMPVSTEYGSIPSSYQFHPIKYMFLDSNSWSFNHGHYLNDNVMPTFVASKMFRFPLEDAQQIFETKCRLFSTLEEAFSYRPVQYNRSLGTYQQACLSRLNGMWPHFYNHPPLYVDDIRQKSLCFKHLITGQGSAYGLKSLDLTRSLYFHDFRDYVVSRIKQTMPAQENLILVGLRTVGSAGGSIIHDLCAQSKAALEKLDEYKSKYNVECFVPSDLSFEDEIKQVQRAKVVISVHGTISYMVLFARDGTQQISIASPKELKENQMLLYATHFNTLYLTWDKIEHLKGVLEHSLTLSEAYHYDNLHKGMYITYNGKQSARKLNEVLRTGISDGIQGLCLMTVEGSIVVSAFSDEHLAMRRDARNEDLPDEVALTAIASTIWTQYTSGSTNDVSFHLIKTEQGYLAISAVSKNYLLAGIGNVNPGLFRSRLQVLSSYFAKVFDQLK